LLPRSLLEFPLSTKDRRGNAIKLEEKDWLHILLRHEEVGDDPVMLLSYVQDSNEVYLDKEGIVHYINPINSKHFIVVICEIEKGEGYIRTAYIINLKEKKRRYGRLQRLEIS
jgi:hypothetical protein